ncbi:MAG: hypothetical protein AAB152_07380 [Candidatus Coatesbacteria bacterium]
MTMIKGIPAIEPSLDSRMAAESREIRQVESRIDEIGAAQENVAEFRVRRRFGNH